MASRPLSPEQKKLRAAQRKLAREMRAVREGRKKYEVGEAGKAYQRAIRRQRSIFVLAQISPTQVATVEVHGAPAEKRRQIARHWNLIREYLGSGDPYDVNYNPRKLKQRENAIRRYEGRMTGGTPSVEFANDPEAITAHYLADPDDFTFESIYPHVTT